MSRQKREISGLAVAVTGAGRGIGAAIAATLSAAGARVLLGDVDAVAVTEMASSLPGCVGLALDVTDERSFQRFIADGESALGPIDVLVNNAGVMWVGSFESEPAEATQRQLAVNVVGVINGFRVVAPAMRARGGGHIITIASAGSRIAPAGEATYAATKHAVLGYCTAVRAELAGSGVLVSVVMPTVVETALALGTSHGRGVRLTPQQVANAVARTIRSADPEVFVPRYMGVLAALLTTLPHGIRQRLHAALVPNQVAATDPEARADYARDFLRKS